MRNQFLSMAKFFSFRLLRLRTSPLRSSLLSSALLPLVLAPLVLSSCAFSEGQGGMSDPNRRRQIEDRQKLVDSYSALQGVYEGTYTRTNGAVEPVKFTFSYREQVAGTNQDGELIYRPILLVKYERISTTEEDNRMQGSFIPETGDLTLTTRTVGQDNVCDGECLYMKGTWLNGGYSSAVRSISGIVLGTINIQRVTTQVDGPSDGDVWDDYEEEKERVQKFVGKYIGKAKSNIRGEPDMEIEIILSVVDGPKSEGPKLISTSYRTDGFSRAATHNVIYNYRNGADQIIFQPTQGAMGFDAYTMTAFWENGEIKGDLRLPKNAARRFEAKRVN